MLAIIDESDRHGRENGYPGGCMPNENLNCASISHSEHLCSLYKKGCLTEMVYLQKDPNYVCQNCGRKSHAAENLCTPSLIGT